MGDDERFEYVYKFVSRDPAHRELRLEHGTLYAARFDADGTGVWLELAPGQNGLDAAAGFPSQAEICIAPRLAGEVAGATTMDRPEWIAVHPQTGEAYCALSYNETRGQPGRPGPDPANPRAENVYGHIIRWRERGGDPTATRFEWDVFILCGDPGREANGRQGDLRLAGRAVGGRARRAVDPDRRVHPAPPQGRLRGHGQQPDAGRRSGHAGGAAIPHRPPRLRGHRRDRHAGRADDVREHPAPGGDAERAEQPGHAEGRSARGRRARPGGDPARPPW